MNKISLNDVVSQLSIALDAVEKDLLGATAYHSKRVGVFSLAIGRKLGYSKHRLFGLATCAMLHDNALTEYILSEQPDKNQKFNMKSHCIIGEENCKFIPIPYDVTGFILYHHENIDGTGAFGKTQGEYPQEAEIISIADKIDVQFKLQIPDSDKISNINNYILQNTGTKHSMIVSTAALNVLSEDFLKNMTDDKIFSTLKSQLPKFDTTLSDDEIINLSGIIAKIIDYKSVFTQEHSTQIANKAWYMSGIYGYSNRQRAELYIAAAMHDIGKLFIPTGILEKPDVLTSNEFSIIKSHAEYTWDVLQSISGFEEIALWASNHHEKLDGSGYPFGKRAHELDFNSRLLACLDIYQAVRETRPYHPPRSHEDTMDILYIMANKGLIDINISKDLDKHLALLQNGHAPSPFKS